MQPGDERRVDTGRGPRSPDRAGSWARAARVRFEYREAGVVMQEDVYCALLYVTSAASPTIVYWRPARFYSFRAPKGRLEAVTPLLHTIVSSLRYDPTWFNRYYRVGLRQRQGGIQLVHDSGTLAQYLSGFSDRDTPGAHEAYQRQLAADAAVLRGFGEYVRGLELYRSPFQPQIPLPAGYNQVWRASTGGFILSRDAAFTPHRTESSNWARLEHVSKAASPSRSPG